MKHKHPVQMRKRINHPFSLGCQDACSLGLLLFVAALLLGSFRASGGTESSGAGDSAAQGVLRRLMGERVAGVQLEPLPPENGCDAYEYEAQDGDRKSVV